MDKDIKDIVLAEKPDLFIESTDGERVRILSVEDESFLEEKYEEIILYLRNNHDQNISEEEKDKRYKDLVDMWQKVSGKNGRMNEISFNLILNRKEYNYLRELISNKMEYNVDTVFYAIEIYNMMNEMLKEKDFDNDSQLKAFNMTPVDVHYLYHIISKNTEKGLSKRAFLFAEVIRKISYSSKVFNYYKSKFDNISKALQFWVHSLDKGVAIPENDKVYDLIWGGTDIKPDFGTEEISETSEKTPE